MLSLATPGCAICHREYHGALGHLHSHENGRGVERRHKRVLAVADREGRTSRAKGRRDRGRCKAWQHAREGERVDHGGAGPAAALGEVNGGLDVPLGSSDDDGRALERCCVPVDYQPRCMGPENRLETHPLGKRDPGVLPERRGCCLRQGADCIVSVHCRARMRRPVVVRVAQV